MNLPAASRLRQEVRTLRTERALLEEQILQPLRLLRASLIRRRLGSGKDRRTKAYEYLSIPGPKGRPRLLYVRRRDVDRVEREVQAYRTYRKTLARLRALSPRMLSVLKALGRNQEVAPPR